jgi:tetratricopeptide (TPR) repeat protein
MSIGKLPRTIIELFGGRWQLPLAAVAAGMAALTLHRLMPVPPQPDFPGLLADVDYLITIGDLEAVGSAVGSLLAMQPPLPAEQQAILHDRMATALFTVEQTTADHDLQRVNKLLEHAAAARTLGVPVTSQRLYEEGLAQGWVGRNTAAVAGLREALQQDLPPRARRAAARQIVELLGHNPQVRREREETLAQLLNDETLPASYRWWALRTGVYEALADNEVAAAQQWLDRFGAPLETAELAGYREHLRAWVALRGSGPQEAEPLVRWVTDWLAEPAHDVHELDRFGHLASFHRCLVGELALALGRPEEALAAFAAAREIQVDVELTPPLTLGEARAHAAAGRHVEARDALRVGLRRLLPLRRYFEPAVVAAQRALRSFFDERRAAQDAANAVAYAVFAGALTDRDPLGALRDEDEPDLPAWPQVELALRFFKGDEARLSWLLWTFAELSNQAGRPVDVRRALTRFVHGRPDDARLPLALLRLGQACEAAGCPDDGLRWYARLMEAYPRLVEASQAKVLSAGARVALGEAHYPEAERILTELLVDGGVAPDSPIYRDGLLNLCELLYHGGRYADAIARLDDFLQLYPQDHERFRAWFTLADAQRRSACHMRAQAPGDASGAAVMATSRQRFQAAAEGYEQLLIALDQAEDQDEALQVYGRLAALYRADCLFELDEPDAQRAALSAYRGAAARYDGQPAALVARVQIANALLRQGEVAEAARAIEGARWLLRSIPPELFTARMGGDRAQWEQFLAAVSSADLFARAFTEAPQVVRLAAKERP